MFLYFLKTHYPCISMSDSFPSPSRSSFTVPQLFVKWLCLQAQTQVAAVWLDIKFSSVVLSQSTVLLCEEMSPSRPLHEDLNTLNREVLGELGLPRLENRTCVGTVDSLPQGLSQAAEY